MRFLVLALFCGLVSPALAEDDYGPMPELPGDLCEEPKVNEVCCPYVTQFTESQESLPWPLYVGKHFIIREAYRRDMIVIERDYSRPCKGRA